MEDHPVNVVVTDDLKRSRLTVFFRFLLAIPHFIWLYVWYFAAAILWVISWFATLIKGESPDWAHNFLASYVRYQTHVTAYANLLANPFPGFDGSPNYPVTVDIAPPDKQRRLITFFRLLLGIPAFIIAAVLQIPLAIVSMVGWFVGLILGRWPASFERITTYCLQYNVRTNAYTMLLTERYPRLGHARGVDELESAPEMPGAPEA